MRVKNRQEDWGPPLIRPSSRVPFLSWSPSLQTQPPTSVLQTHSRALPPASCTQTLPVAQSAELLAVLTSRADPSSRPNKWGPLERVKGCEPEPWIYLQPLSLSLLIPLCDYERLLRIAGLICLIGSWRAYHMILKFVSAMKSKQSNFLGKRNMPWRMSEIKKRGFMCMHAHVCVYVYLCACLRTINSAQFLWLGQNSLRHI